MRDDIKFILPTSWEPDKDAFLAQLGVVKGGLGEHFFGSVFDAFFTNAVDAKREFQRYYSVEYGSLSDYLQIRYGLVLSDDDLGCEHVFLVTWVPQVVDQDYENNKFDVVIECIRELERSQNEDQT